MGNEEEKRFEDLCRQGDQLFFRTLFKQKNERCPLEETTAPATVDGLDADEPPVPPGRDEGAEPVDRMPEDQRAKSGPA